MTDWICEKCRSRVVTDEFSTGRCFVCGKILMCVNAPPDVMCLDCTKMFNACVCCGKPLEARRYEFV